MTDAVVFAEVAPEVAQVALDLPLPGLFDYLALPDLTLARGDWVVVPWGRGRRAGLVMAIVQGSDLPLDRLKPVIARLPDMPRADASWLALLHFAARYYHCPLGEIALPAVPKSLRSPPPARARGTAVSRARARFDAQGTDTAPGQGPASEHVLTAQQQQVLEALVASEGPQVHLLHGITGSGKTEVYLQWIAHRLGVSGPAPAAGGPTQALILVPEIALTPELARRIRARFPQWPLAVLHSDMPEAQRAAQWLAAAEGRARIVLGTRLAVLAPLPGLAAVVVDEEHDPSFKQQEGARYSARDLAIALGAQRKLPVLLGSATPSLESWRAAQRGRYRLLTLNARASGATLPEIRLVRLPQHMPPHGLSEVAIDAIRAALGRAEQTLVFLNRRGYAPVLSCTACGWLSQCPQCDAWRVMHRRTGGRAAMGPQRYRLVCHHCAAESPVPARCPDCGNVDLTGLGQGTQRLEEHLAQLFPGARIGRLDRDVARHRGAAASFIAAAHAGEMDILLGTQMLAKGHDFERLTQVVVVDADAALYAADFRAPERLFATLMQVAGRAGRHRPGAAVWVQTRFAEHPLFAALQAHDFNRFADIELAARESIGLPPFQFQALLTAHARTAEAAHDWLSRARTLIGPLPAGVVVCDPVPMPLAQLRGEHRLQMLVESASRPALHGLLGPWVDALHSARPTVRWQLVVDPLEI